MFTLWVCVQYPIRWTVREQDINTFWNCIPNNFFIIKAILECVSNIIGTVRWSKYFDSLNLHHLMFEVDASFFEFANDLFLRELNQNNHTLQGKRLRYLYFCLFDMHPLSRIISWLPEMTILCLNFNLSRNSKNSRKCYSRP